MDASKVIETIANILKTVNELAPTVIQTVQDAKPLAESIYNVVIKGNKVTDEELEALEAHVMALSDELQEPLPPE